MIERLLVFIGDLIHNKFYGKLTISFEAGNIVNLKKEESIKLS